MFLWKSGETIRITRLWMLASAAAMAAETCARAPGLFCTSIEMTTLW